jgi:hypothetical protein
MVTFVALIAEHFRQHAIRNVNIAKCCTKSQKRNRDFVELVPLRRFYAPALTKKWGFNSLLGKIMKKLLVVSLLLGCTNGFAAVDVLAKAYDTSGYQNDWISMRSDNAVGITNDTNAQQTYVIYYSLCVEGKEECAKDRKTITLKAGAPKWDHMIHLELMKQFAVPGYRKIVAYTQVVNGPYSKDLPGFGTLEVKSKY